jgi:hypothetical protein
VHPTTVQLMIISKNSHEDEDNIRIEIVAAGDIWCYKYNTGST